MYKLKNSGINGNLLDLIESFNWKSVKVGVPQDSVLGHLFALICINDLRQGLISDAKLFADNTSLFSVVNCAKACPSVLNSDLSKMQDWAYQ